MLNEQMSLTAAFAAPWVRLDRVPRSRHHFASPWDSTLVSVKRSQRRRQNIVLALAAGCPKKLWWCEATTRSAISRAVELGIDSFVFRSADIVQSLSGLAKYTSIIVDRNGSFSYGEGATGEFLTCKNASDVQMLQKHLLTTTNFKDTYVIDLQSQSTWSVIPSENLIAIKQQADFPSKILVVVSTVDEARTMISLLDSGMDGVILRSDCTSEISRYAALKNEHEAPSHVQSTDIAVATIVDVKIVGNGDRACLDFCSILDESEGIFVGSSSQSMFLVLSEAAQNDYVPSRPFRCNAGPVHSYVLCANGKTKYLSELEAGDELPVVRMSGTTPTSRNVVLGRVKIEHRPLVLVQAKIEQSGVICNILVQNAETVRIACLDSNQNVVGRSVAELERGFSAILRVDTAARHIGMPIVEALIEN